MNAFKPLRLCHLIAVIIFSAGGCVSHQDKGVLGADVPSLAALGVVDYSTVRTYVIYRSCMPCHGPGGGQRDFTSYSSLLNVVVPREVSQSRMFQKLYQGGGNMPKNGVPITANQLAIVTTWIQQGAVNTGGATAPACITPPTDSDLAPLEATFASIQKRLLNTSCTDCHGGANPAGHLDLTSYQHMQAYVNQDPSLHLIEPGAPDKSLFYQALALPNNPNAMPKKREGECGPRQLPNGTADAVFLWILTGATENP